MGPAKSCIHELVQFTLTNFPDEAAASIASREVASLSAIHAIWEAHQIKTVQTIMQPATGMHRLLTRAHAHAHTHARTHARAHASISMQANARTHTIKLASVTSSYRHAVIMEHVLQLLLREVVASCGLLPVHETLNLENLAGMSNFTIEDTWANVWYGLQG
eukprot:1159854-Pelagomonas_calceolata.AAC.2